MITILSWRVCKWYVSLSDDNVSSIKAGVYMKLSEILGSLKRDWKAKKGYVEHQRQLPDPTMSPQAGEQLFGVYLPIFNFKF